MRKAKKKYPNEILDVIPSGDYCHGDYVDNPILRFLFNKKYKYICPFWFKIKNRQEQECGYCYLLGKGDYEMNREYREIIETRFINGKAKRRLIRCGPDNPSMTSLLWDKVKECGQKIEEK